MAAVRHGGHRIHEFRERELDHELPGTRRKDRDRGRDIRYCFGDRQSDSKEWEQLNGYHCSTLISSSLSGCSGRDQKQSRLRLVDGIEAPVSLVRDAGVCELEKGALPSPNRKRKFSSITRDTDCEKKSSFITTRVINGEQELDALPPLSSLSHGCILPHPIKKMQQSDEQPSPYAPLDLRWSNDREPGEIEVEEDENILARSIAASRWTDCNNALEDDVEVALKLRRTPSSHLAGQLTRDKDQSPELGVVIMRDCSEGAASNLFDSDGDYMDISGKEDDEDASDHSSDTDSEADGVVRTQETPEQVQLPQRGPSCINMLQECRSVDEFEWMNKINEGTYGVVYRARDRKTGQIVALKKVKMEKEKEGFPLTSLREINILMSLEHHSIVGVKEVAVGSKVDDIYMVMEYMEHDLKGLMETMKRPFSQSEVKCLMLQLLEGVDYLHDNWVLHRDLKTSNILMSNCGELKICDFGLSRRYGSPLKPYTQLVVTLWYRAPELLLGGKEYSNAIDMWSLGCIMAELLANEPLFNGKTEFDQLDKIFRILGRPDEKMWPGFTKLPGAKFNFVKHMHNKLRDKFPPASFSGRPTLSKAGFDLLNKLLTYDPDKRITAKTALNHDWFRETPLPKSKEFMPTFPSQHAKRAA